MILIASFEKEFQIQRINNKLTNNFDEKYKYNDDIKPLSYT